MAPRVIALYSPVMQSGKSTTADYLSNRGYSPARFCDPLKAMADILLGYAGLSEDDIWDRVWGSKKEVPISQIGGCTGRRLMQTLGTEWGRDTINPNLWANILSNRIKTATETKFVIDDMRFPNEYFAIRNIPNSEVWCVVRPGLQATNGHPSEGQLNGYRFDHTIINSGTIHDLHVRINEALL